MVVIPVLFLNKASTHVYTWCIHMYMLSEHELLFYTELEKIRNKC
ncbi:MAG: hypothetical protein QW551_07250 [Desulfurococcaceae archaeon]